MLAIGNCPQTFLRIAIAVEAKLRTSFAPCSLLPAPCSQIRCSQIRCSLFPLL
ncbi:hypothetical protein [Moorena producens]|uniref:hypothetical protein n=1 Tax=Moorena producens TaxID=1155739 RepID=UPI000ADAAC20|nr:hypothetical protein [Moorena producens]